MAKLMGLHNASQWNHTDFIKELLQQKENIDKEDINGRTPLYMAILCNQVEAAIILLQYGADITKVPSEADKSRMTHMVLEEWPSIKDSVIDWSYQDLSDADVLEKLEQLPPCDKVKAFLLNENNLTRVPPVNKFECMKELIVLGLDHNDIEKLPDLPVPDTLQVLHLRDINLKLIGKQSILQEWKYELLKRTIPNSLLRTQLLQPPPEVFFRGYNSVLQYFQEGEYSRYKQHNTKRVVFIGDTEAGKTSLVHTLMSRESFLTAASERTQVVEKHLWEISEMATYMVFDQGGHPIYNVTNRIFLSKKALIILVHSLFSSSEPSIQRSIGFLKTVLQVNPHATIHVALSKTDALDSQKIDEKYVEFQQQVKHVLQKNIDVFQSHFEKIIKQHGKEKETLRLEQLVKDYERQLSRIQYFLTSSKNNQGTEELRDFLKNIAENNPAIIPSSWQDLFEDIKRRKDNFIMVKDVQFPWPMRFKTVLDFYTDIGLLLHFSDHKLLQNYIFHDIKFIIDLMKSLFHHDFQKKIVWSCHTGDLKKSQFDRVLGLYKHQGLLNNQLLPYIWNEYGLKRTDEEAIIEVMIAMDICYKEIDNENAKYLFIPWLVQSTAIPTGVDIQNPVIFNAEKFTQHLTCEFVGTVPECLMRHLTVRVLNHAITNLQKPKTWSNGVYVRAGKCQYLMYEDIEQPRINIAISSSDVSEFWKCFQSIYEHLKSILQQWDGAIADIIIQCLHCMINGIHPQYKWLPEEVFPDTPINSQFLDCGDDEDIPAAMVTFLCTTDPCYVQKVQDFNDYWKRKIQERETKSQRCIKVQPHADANRQGIVVPEPGASNQNRQGTGVCKQEPSADIRKPSDPGMEADEPKRTGSTEMDKQVSKVGKDKVRHHLSESRSRGLFVHEGDYKLSRKDYENILQLTDYVCAVFYHIPDGSFNGTGLFLGFVEPQIPGSIVQLNNVIHPSVRKKVLPSVSNIFTQAGALSQPITSTTFFPQQGFVAQPHIGNTGQQPGTSMTLFPQPFPHNTGPPVINGTVAVILISAHILEKWNPNIQSGELIFDWYEHHNVNVLKSSTTGLIAVDDTLDYALLFTSDHNIISRFQNSPQPRQMVTTNIAPSPRKTMVLLGHPSDSHMQGDHMEVIDKQIFETNQDFKDAFIASQSGFRKGTNLHVVEQEFSVIYQCSSLHGASGAPCFRLHGGYVELVCIHSGGIFLNKTDPTVDDESNYEFGILMSYILDDINKNKLPNLGLQWKN